MKATFLKSALLTLCAVCMLVACKKEKDNVSVSISATSPTYVEGKVDLIVALSEVSTATVSASIAASGDIPEAALSFDKKVTIPAGSVTATVPVTVDASALEAGTYETTFTISSVTGGSISGSRNSCKVSLVIDPSEILPQVSIPSYSEAFTSGKAVFKVALDRSAEADVVVNFEVKTDLGEYQAVPASALTFANPVTIPAGSTELDVEVTLDESVLTKGVSYYAVIAIASVSENAKVAARKVQTYTEALVNIEANLRSDWSVTFAGEYVKDEKTYHSIQTAGMGEEGTYYIFVFEGGYVAANFENPTDLAQTLEKVVSKYIGTENAYQIKKGETGWLYNIFPIGAYEIWLFGCTAEGHITGDYTTSTFHIDATAEELEAYNKWLGEWNVTRKDLTDKWEITQKYPGGSFYIQGIDGTSTVISDILVEADYDTANDQIIIYAQDCKIWTYKGVDYTVGLLGITTAGGLVSGSFDLAKVQKVDENTATIVSGGQVTLSSGTYDVGGMTFMAYDENGSGYVFNGQTFYTWPETMTRILPINDDPVYNAFLGKWNIKRNDSEWDSDAKDWKDLGEVTDVWEITPKLAGYSYYISGIEGYDDLIIKADYDVTSGSFTVSEQNFTVDDYSFCLAGLFHYPGDASNEEGDYLYDSGATLFTATKDGDVINMAVGQAGSYGDFLSMQVYETADGKYYNLHDEGYALPNTLTKYVEPSSAPRHIFRSGRFMAPATRSFATGKSRRSSMQRAKLFAKDGRKVERNASVR